MLFSISPTICNVPSSSIYGWSFCIKTSANAGCINNKNGILKDKFNESNVKIDYCLILPEDKNYRPYRLYKLLRKISSHFFGFKLFFQLRKDSSTIIHSEESIKKCDKSN